MVISCHLGLQCSVVQESVRGYPVWPTASSVKPGMQVCQVAGVSAWPARASQPSQMMLRHGCQLQTASKGCGACSSDQPQPIPAPLSALQAALLLLDLQLGTCADKALQALADAEPAASLAADIAVCKSRAAFLCGREEGGTPAWQPAQQSCACCAIQRRRPLPTWLHGNSKHWPQHRHSAFPWQAVT